MIVDSSYGNVDLKLTAVYATAGIVDDWEALMLRPVNLSAKCYEKRLMALAGVDAGKKVRPS